VALYPGGPGGQTSKFRFMPDANYTVEDASQPVPPETRQDAGFLIMSASQDNEFAQEQMDENKNPHGAFTIALLDAINQQSVDASALNLFSSIRAILKSNAKTGTGPGRNYCKATTKLYLVLRAGFFPNKSLVAISGFKNG